MLCIVKRAKRKRTGEVICNGNAEEQERDGKRWKLLLKFGRAEPTCVIPRPNIRQLRRDTRMGRIWTE